MSKITSTNGSGTPVERLSALAQVGLGLVNVTVERTRGIIYFVVDVKLTPKTTVRSKAYRSINHALLEVEEEVTSWALTQTKT